MTEQPERMQPIEPEYVQMMNDLAVLLREMFPGFMLLVFEPNTSHGRMNYICNCNREDMCKAMEEFVAKARADAAASKKAVPER